MHAGVLRAHLLHSSVNGRSCFGSYLPDLYLGSPKPYADLVKALRAQGQERGLSLHVALQVGVQEVFLPDGMLSDSAWRRLGLWSCLQHPEVQRIFVSKHVL